MVFARQIRLSFGSLIATQVKWVGINRRFDCPAFLLTAEETGQIASLITECFKQHPDHALFTSLPGAGPKLAPRLLGELVALLEDITGNTIRTLDDVGILPNPRSALVHGPLKLCLDGAWLDLSLLHGSFRLSQADIERAEKIETASLRCLTIENETTFHELAKLRSGELLVCTSYPGSATVALLRRLPSNLD